MTLHWTPINLARDARVIPGNQRKRYVEKLLKALDNSAISIEDLIRVTQYDLTNKKPRWELTSATRRIANILGFQNKKKLRNETSSTYLFSTATYYLLKDFLKQRGLAFVIEPRILGTHTVTYDYAIVDIFGARISVLVEVKRLQRLGNIDDYVNTFKEKVREITYLIRPNSIKHVALHLHATPDLCKEYKGIEKLLASVGLLLSETKQPILIISTNTCDPGQPVVSFQKLLLDQVSATIID